MISLSPVSCYHVSPGICPHIALAQFDNLPSFITEKKASLSASLHVFSSVTTKQYINQSGNKSVRDSRNNYGDSTLNTLVVHAVHGSCCHFWHEHFPQKTRTSINWTHGSNNKIAYRCVLMCVTKLSIFLYKPSPLLYLLVWVFLEWKDTCFIWHSCCYKIVAT